MSSKSILENGMKEVGIIKEIYSLSGLILCRKCRQAKEPLNTGKLKSMNDTETEQYYSGVCSDKCWNKSSELELMEYKYLFPVYLHKECNIQKVNLAHPNGGWREIDHNKNPIYKH